MADADFCIIKTCLLPEQPASTAVICKQAMLDVGNEMVIMGDRPICVSPATVRVRVSMRSRGEEQEGRTSLLMQVLSLVLKPIDNFTLD